MDAAVSPPDGLVLHGPGQILVSEQLWLPQHHSGQRGTAGLTGGKNVPTFRPYKWRRAAITQNRTLHFESGASGPVKRYYTIFFICGLWFWLWDHQINSAPTPLRSKILANPSSVTAGHRTADLFLMVYTFGRGGGVAGGHPSGPAAPRAGVEHLQQSRVGVGGGAVTAPLETFSKHNQMN